MAASCSERMRYVLIEVSGGVVQQTYTDDEEIEVYLIDHDNTEAGDPAAPSRLLPACDPSLTLEELAAQVLE